MLIKTISKQSFLLILLFALLQSCSNSKELKKDHVHEPKMMLAKKQNSNSIFQSNLLEIIIGEGGGIAPQERSFVIKRDGRIYRSLPDRSLQIIQIDDSSSTRSEVSPKNTLNDIHQDIAEILDLWKTLPDQNISSPGNRYRFVEINTVDGNKRWTWDHKSVQVPENLSVFYDKCFSIFKKTIQVNLKKATQTKAEISNQNPDEETK